MASKFTQLIAVAALAGGMYVVAGTQPQRAPQTAAVTAPAPKAKPATPTRTKVHRNTHRPVPKSAKRKVWPKLPGVKPIPPIAKEERRGRAKAKRQRIAKARLPSCAIVRREYERMNWAQKMARYASATQEEVAHGRRCLGL